jgi:hypothetical protein
MVLRRALFWAQFGMAVALPVWVLVSRGIVADGIGWQLVIYLVLAPVLFIALGLVVALTVARKRVRETRAVSWRDAVALLVTWAAIFTYGLFAFPLLAVIVVLAVVALFWLVTWELVTETRDRVKTFFDAATAPAPRQIPDVIVVPRNPLSR